jgi:hypothetical protein
MHGHSSAFSDDLHHFSDPERKSSAHCRRPLIDHLGQKADDVVGEK